ncbi:hypothetical protein YC2023_116228 [Brassica napus]
MFCNCSGHFTLKKIKPYFSAVRAKCFAGETPDTGVLFREKLIYLHDLNIDPQKALRVNPSLRAAPISSVETLLSSTGLSRPTIDFHLRPALAFLKTQGFVGRDMITWRNTVLLVSSVERTLVPKNEYLEVGFT